LYALDVSDDLHDLSVGLLIGSLRSVQISLAREFEKQRKRSIEHADKVKKVVEEIGEVIQAAKDIGPRTEATSDEIWDSVIAALSQFFVFGFSDGEILQSLKRTLQKLERRHC
jgi:NTP pyrophosphatase (non-canonical NTP hydrolase)